MILFEILNCQIQSNIVLECDFTRSDRQFPSMSIYINIRKKHKRIIFLNVNIVRIIGLSLTLDQNMIFKTLD
jgi:hypothetical protein